MMKRRISVEKMIELLRKENIKTWFDLGLFIDRFKESNPVPTAKFNGSYQDFKKHIAEKGIAFLTYGYSIDGVTIEILKYAKIFRNNYPEIPIHLIGGNFQPETYKLIDPTYKKFEIIEARSFDDWKLYKEFFFVKLERGSKEYNDLILRFWDEVLTITEKLGKYIEDEDIQLLYIVNVASNPGNVSLTLATIFVTEYLGLPVINNNHDFYWEGGNSEITRNEKGLKPEPRDFFFTNSHLGEFFSQIEVLYPWESRSWVSVNINHEQTKHVVDINGHNPANVCEIGTAVDISDYMDNNKRKKINTFYQFEKILSRYQKTLIAYAARDVIQNRLVDPGNTRPILIGCKKTKPIRNFLAENIVFLQPTRIISRKRIEVSFRLLKKLFGSEKFRSVFNETENLKLTILVTGPIAGGHFNYFEKLIKRFHIFLQNLDEEFRGRVYLAFLFSELDKEKFKIRFENPVGIVDLYNIASLILLPSETEGRGLPIIEAAACGTPIFCNRYYPEHVYSDVIGEHLPEKDRLNVIEFDGKKIRNKQINRIINEVFYPHMAGDIFRHNQEVVQKRYSLDSLNNNIFDICHKLYSQLQSNNRFEKTCKKSLKEYKEIVNFSSNDLRALINTKNRHYLPGFGRLSYMLNLKSLIDPSAFRAEEQQIKGMIFSFAEEMIEENPESEFISDRKRIEFYNTVENIFRINEGEVKIQHDHSFAYRHRNKKHYLYQDFTYQEITGLINILYHKIIQPKRTFKIDAGIHFFTDWNLALSQMTASADMRIDDRAILMQKMKENIPLGIFSGKYVKHELEFFVLQAIRSRYKLKLEEELTEKKLLKDLKGKNPIYLFLREKPIRGAAPAEEVIEFIQQGSDNELKLLLKHQLLQIVKTKQLSVGVHFPQLGKVALKILNHIRIEKGLLISHHRNAAVMTDIIDIDRIHIDRVVDPLTANIMGISEGSGYIQFVPAGVRTTLAYPTPIQTAYDFHLALNSADFKELSKKLGKEKLFSIIREDAEKRGSPILTVLNNLKQQKKEKKKYIDHTFVSGVYKDKSPWNGAFAITQSSGNNKKWKYITIDGDGNTKTVTRFIEDFENSTKNNIQIAWNGGYILNAELVGKLGIPESYIGSPLGLLISDYIVKCPPLFNKPALLVHRDGKIDIQRVNCENGLVICNKVVELEFNKSNYNLTKPGLDPCYYDLMFDEEYLYGNGRVIVRMAGNTVKEIIRSKKGEKVKIIPVGLTFSFDPENYPENMFEVERELDMIINGYEEIQYAVEAGPMLVNDGKFSLDMEKEGWKTSNSIKTQAARLDYIDMRGPKIAVGIDKNGNLAVLTINGRIRESVGATHIDMANILVEFGIKKGMGFDPGGSSTLVVGGEVLNISPYNHDYEKNIYSLPPEPRAVSNVVVGFLE